MKKIKINLMLKEEKIGQICQKKKRQLFQNLTKIIILNIEFKTKIKLKKKHLKQQNVKIAIKE